MNSQLGKPKYGARGIRPHIWKSGPDPEDHKKYLVWQQQRNQALFRNEIWTIEFKDWCAIWKDLWHLRGRQRDSYCMSRLDWDKGWTVDNVRIIPRLEHARLQRDHRMRGWRSEYREKERAIKGYKRGKPNDRV